MRFGTSVATGILIGAAFCNLAVAQGGSLYGRVYTFHSNQSGACPGMDWHAVVEPNGTLSGMVSWDNMKHIARLTGTVDEQVTPTTFQATAKEEGGAGKTAHISGQVRPEDGRIVGKITGTGTGCDNQMIEAKWFTPGPSSE